MGHSSDIGPALITRDELANLLNLSLPTIDKYIHGRRIPYLKLGPQRNAPVRFNADEVRGWLDKTRIAPIHIEEGR